MNFHRVRDLPISPQFPREHPQLGFLRIEAHLNYANDIQNIWKILSKEALYKFVNVKEILQSEQFGLRKGFGTVDTLLTVVR